MAESNDDLQNFEDLDQLLNSALNELNNPSKINETESTDEKKHQNAYYEAEELNKLTDNFKKLMDASNDKNLDEKVFEELRKQLEENIKKFPEDATSEEEMAKIWEQCNQLSEDGNEMPPFFLDVMQKLLSKDVLYPSLKDLSTKFPEWLSKNKNTLSGEEFERFSKQHKLVDQVCSYYEEETEINDFSIESKRFQKILAAMHEMQQCGQPPEELVKSGLASRQNPDFPQASMEDFNKLMEGNDIDQCKTM